MMLVSNATESTDFPKGPLAAVIVSLPEKAKLYFLYE